MSSQNNTTIKDVASAAGVSTTTVFKVLNNQGKISPGMRNLILEKVEELHYVPNRFAKALRKSIKIAVVAASFVEEYQKYVYKGIESAFSAYEGTNVTKTSFAYGFENQPEQLEEFYGQILEDGSFDAVILQVSVTNQTLDALLREMLDRGMVVYFLGGHPKVDAPISVISSNAKVIGRMASQFLSVASSNKKVAILAPDQIDGMHVGCIESFMSSKFAQELSVVSVCETQYHREPFRKAVGRLFSEHPDITGIYVASYNAPLLCDYLREHPLPHSVTVIGHDLYPDIVRCLKDGSLAATVFQNQEGQGKLAVGRIIQCLNREPLPNGGLGPFQEFITPQLVMLSNLECYRY